MAKTNAAARRQEAIAAIIEPEKERILRKQIDLAAAGDPSAAKLVLGYLAAPATAPERTVKLPGMQNAKTLVQKVEAVLDAVAAGEVSPATGEALMKSLAVLSQAVQVEEVMSRVAALERQARNGGVLPAVRVDPQLPNELA